MPKDDKHRKLKAKRENIESYLKINKIFIKKKKTKKRIFNQHMRRWLALIIQSIPANLIFNVWVVVIVVVYLLHQEDTAD